jgi:CTP synthase
VLLSKFGLKPRRKIDLTDWEKLVGRIRKEKKQRATIAIVGKYFATGDSNLRDTYYALFEAISHAAWAQDVEVDLRFVNSEKQAGSMDAALNGVDGIIVPIGWGTRGVEGKIEAVRFARENKIPYLGLCYGMQLAAVEFARNVAGLKGAHTEECDPGARHKIIHSIPFDPKYQVIKGEGASMRLGTFDCVVKKGTRVHEIYEKYKGFKDAKKSIVAERHRHRFEFNNAYRKRLQDAGLVISGVSPDNFFVEMIELPKAAHPFFVATQGHPEYKSQPTAPHPIFMAFIDAAVAKR